MEHVERQTVEAAQAASELTLSSLASPLNVIILGAVLYTIYAILRPSAAPEIPSEAPATVFRTYTPRTLLDFSGEGNSPVYLAVRGRVFDVSRGRNFYGPGGPYANFAGHDASRGLAFGSFDEDMLTADLDGPLDPLDNLDKDQLEALQGWEDRFLEKYDVVGQLVSVADYEAKHKS